MLSSAKGESFIKALLEVNWVAARMSAASLRLYPDDRNGTALAGQVCTAQTYGRWVGVLMTGGLECTYAMGVGAVDSSLGVLFCDRCVCMPGGLQYL